jgi:peptidoglycan/LPS O-acetylase OafA/YrhL
MILLCPVLRCFALNHGVPYVFVHSSTFYRADSLVAGGALSLLLRSRWHDRVLCAGGWLALFAALAMLFSSAIAVLPNFPTPQGRAALEAVSYSLLAIGYAGLLILSLGRSGWRRAFSLRPMRFLGKYSYGLYVLHLILLAYFEQPLRDWLRQMNVGKGLSIVIVGVVGFAVSIAAAVLSYQLYERHFLRLKRFFDYRPHKPASRPAAQERAPAAPALQQISPPRS